MYINFTEFSYENNTNYATALMNEHIKQNAHAVRNQSRRFGSVVCPHVIYIFIKATSFLSLTYFIYIPDTHKI